MYLWLDLLVADQIAIVIVRQPGATTIYREASTCLLVGQLRSILQLLMQAVVHAERLSEVWRAQRHIKLLQRIHV